MTGALSPQDLAAALSAHAGGYLRNPVRERRVTCQVCATPVDGFDICYPCREHRLQAGRFLADAVGFCTYAIDGRQSGHLMYGYKSRLSGPTHRSIVSLLVGLALTQHTSCVAKLRTCPVTHWTTVPSLNGRPGEHPLHQSAAVFPQGTEVPVEAATTQNPRGLSATHFRIGQQLPPSSHVLVVDDTWVSGGHMQSLVLALREAGAAQVSALAIARWLKPDRDPTREFVRTRLTPDFQPLACPWTSHACP
ncbi:hypothetical protein GCM10025762_33910 [Haloechinothrix salitolerans]